MKALPCWLVAHHEKPETVLFRIIDPRAIPPNADRIELDGKSFRVKHISKWYEDAALREQAYETRDFLQQLQKKMSYNHPDKEDLEKKIAECHYYIYCDVLIEPIVQAVK